MATAPASLPALEQLRAATHRSAMLLRYGTVFDRAQHARDRWDGRWERSLLSVWPKPEMPGDLDVLVAAGVEENEYLAKGPYWDAVRRALRRIFGGKRDYQRSIQNVYLSLAEDTAEDSGQSTLDALGLNETFKWTSVRDLPRDMFQVRGSKIIQAAYGNHVDRLRDIIVDATDPSRPKSQSQIRRLIQDEWSDLTAKQVARIARSEAAVVWETTNYNTARANNVEEFEWLKASGPSIGPPKSEDVCPKCTLLAARGPYRTPNVPLPPAHPHCRCTLVPMMEEDWLPPAETWSGGPWPELPLVEAPVP